MLHLHELCTNIGILVKAKRAAVKRKDYQPKPKSELRLPNPLPCGSDFAELICEQLTEKHHLRNWRLFCILHVIVASAYPPRVSQRIHVFSVAGSISGCASVKASLSVEPSPSASPSTSNSRSFLFVIMWQ